jgi:tRNA threonylcarbamoyladenosine biosynthesis protein TsaB
MTILLAIETSTEMASVALLNERGLIIRELAGVQTHSQGVLPAIQEILEEACTTLKQCDAIAFGCGPGAFTGVRTACGIVQGLAFGADLPILPIVSLLAMAQAAQYSSSEDEFVCVLDARMGEVYWAHYRFQNQSWTQITAPALSTAEQVLLYATGISASLVLGNGAVPNIAEPSEKTFFKMPHAEYVAKLAMIDFRMGTQLQAEQAQPLYLRNKIALTTLERTLLKAS